MMRESENGHSAGNDSPSDTASATATWQFSLRSLFAVTTIVSIVLAVGMFFAGIMFAVTLVVLVHVTVMLASDWLIRPAHRRALAFVTASAWIILGSGLLIIAIQQAIAILAAPKLDMTWAAITVLIGFALACYLLGWYRWKQLTARLHSPG